MGKLNVLYNMCLCSAAPPSSKSITLFISEGSSNKKKKKDFDIIWSEGKMSTEQDVFRESIFLSEEKKNVTQTPSHPYIPRNPYFHKNGKTIFSYIYAVVCFLNNCPRYF